MKRAICSAIKDRAVIQFSYDGGGVRTVEPYCHGLSLADNEVLRGFQTAGYSKSGRPVDWKLFEVAKITGLQQTGTTFQANRPDYNPDDQGMSSVHCHV